MKSIKSRMMLTSLIVLVAFMVLTAIALERAVEKRMLTAEENNLKALMYSVLAAVDRDSTGLSITVSDARLFENALFDSGSGLYALLYDKKAEIWRSLSTDQPFYKLTDLSPEELRFSQIEYNDRSWFQLAFSIRWPNVHDKLSLYELVLWKNAEDHFAQLNRFKQTLWLWLVITVVLLLVLMWLVMLWGLRPLRLIGEEVQAIENNQKQRFDSSYPTEIKPLTQNLNLLLQREQHQMQRYRNALDDLAHSLKTPLAVLRGLSEKSSEWTDEDRHTLQEQNNRMNQIVSYQLQKAAMVGGQSMARPINLVSLLEKTVAALRKVYSHKGVSIELKSDLNSLLRMDESDLLEILGNLIDNACKYGRKQVRINAIQLQQLIRLTIEDDGAGLEPEQLQNILTRGIRLDQTQEGQGIGLAVVNDIVDAYDIGMKFNQSILGGLEVTLEFSNI
mgnify:CR=1 FL=1